MNFYIKFLIANIFILINIESSYKNITNNLMIQLDKYGTPVQKDNFLIKMICNNNMSYDEAIFLIEKILTGDEKTKIKTDIRGLYFIAFIKENLYKMIYQTIDLIKKNSKTDTIPFEFQIKAITIMAENILLHFKKITSEDTFFNFNKKFASECEKYNLFLNQYPNINNNKKLSQKISETLENFSKNFIKIIKKAFDIYNLTGGIFNGLFQSNNSVQKKQIK